MTSLNKENLKNPIGNPITPESYGQPGHDFTLQTILELQKSIGELTAAVGFLKESIDKQDKKVTKLEETMSKVTHKIHTATVIISIFVIISGFIANKSWDIIVKSIV